MATTTNYGWTTPDDTALVKDGAAAIRTLGSSVDTTTKALNPSTTLGDMEYRSSTADTNTRLGIGSTGQVLTVSGGVPAWETASGWSPNYQLLNAGGTSLSSTTTTISGISGKNGLYVWIESASMSGTGYITFRFNSDSGSNYGYFGNYVTTAGGANPVGASGTTEARFSYIGNVAGAMSGYIKIDGTGTAGIKTLAVGSRATNTGGESHTTLGIYQGTSAISSISIIGDATFDAGTVYVYGA